VKRTLKGELKRLFSDSPKGQTDSQEPLPVDVVLAGQLLRFWYELSAHVRNDSNHTEQSGIRQRLGQLEARIAALGDNGVPDMALCRDITGFLALVSTTRYEAALKRIDELSADIQERDRVAGASVLSSTHLQDEMQRCHKVIEEEFIRRGLHRHDGPAPENVHDHLVAFFCALDASDKLPVMGAVLTDPVLAALEKLIATPDPNGLKTFPEWMKRPAVRILDLIAERNRYKRLLEHAGMLPP
jgi:hypothetical protein